MVGLHVRLPISEKPVWHSFPEHVVDYMLKKFKRNAVYADHTISIRIGFLLTLPVHTFFRRHKFIAAHQAHWLSGGGNWSYH